MKFSIVKETLLEALNDFTKIFETKTTTPIIGHIYIEAQTDRLLLIATNTEVTLEAFIPANIEETGKITVPGSKFYDVVRYLPNGMFVNCHLHETQFIINAAKSRFSLTTLPAEDFPHTEKNEFKSSIEINSLLFHRLLQKVKFSMAVDDPRHYFHGIYLDLIKQGEGMNAVSTDGHRLSCAYADVMSTYHDKTGIILPKKAVLELIKLTGRFDECLKLEFNDHQLSLQLANYHFTTNLIDGNYPGYEQVIPDDDHDPVIIQREPFLQALQRAKVLLVDKQDGIRLNFSAGQLLLSARNQDNETANETLDIINNKEEADCELALNINYLIEAVNNIDGENIQMHFVSGESPFLITSKDDANVKYVIMPMRL